MKIPLKFLLFFLTFLFLFSSASYAKSKQKEALQGIENAIYQNLSSYLGIKSAIPIHIPSNFLPINKPKQTKEPIPKGTLKLKPYVNIPPLPNSSSLSLDFLPPEPPQKEKAKKAQEKKMDLSPRISP